VHSELGNPLNSRSLKDFNFKAHATYMDPMIVDPHAQI
jgi:hypothetical protein